MVAAQDHFKSLGWDVRSHFKSESSFYKFARIFGLARESESQDVSDLRIGGYAVKVVRSFSFKESLGAVGEIRKQMRNRLTCHQDVVAALDWALWEIVDNAGRHGYGAYDENDSFKYPVYICAFSYKDGIEVGVVDRGVGFFSRLSEKYPRLDPKMVIRHALAEGVKSHVSGGGMGLTKTYELVGNAGELAIFTSERGLSLAKGKMRDWHCPGLIGTVVKVKFRTDATIPVSDILGRDADDLLYYGS